MRKNRDCWSEFQAEIHFFVTQLLRTTLWEFGSAHEEIDATSGRSSVQEPPGCMKETAQETMNSFQNIVPKYY